MAKVHEVKIGGETKSLRFNNYAHIELSKALFESGHYVSSPSELIDKLYEMSMNNTALLIKAIVYAGIVGYDYEVGFKVSMTQQQVGELIGSIDQTELEGLWDVFLEAMGVNLGDLVSRNEVVEAEETEKKR